MVINTRPFTLNVLALVLFPQGTLAASPWTETTGNTLQVTSDYSSTESGDYPLYASGANSQLITDSGLQFSTTTTGTYVAYLTDQASLELNNATLSTTGSVASGIYADNATLTMTGGTITTEGSQASGIIGNDANLILNDVTILLDGINSTGIKMTGGMLSATGVNISSSATVGGIALSSGASATLDDVSITLLGTSGSNGISLSESALVGNNVTIDSNLSSMAAIQVGNAYGEKSSLVLTDSTINSAYIGIRSMGGDITLNNVSINTTLTGGHAIDVNRNPTDATWSSNLIIRGGSYQTKGSSAHAVWLAVANTTLDAADATFQTEGNSSHAVNAQKGTAIVTDSILTTSGNSSYGFYAENISEGSGLTITTSGRNAYGVIAAGSDAAISIASSTITTSGYGAYAVVANTGSTVNLNDSTISTSGDSSDGLYAQSSSTINADGITVNTTGTDSFALATAKASTLNISNSQLTTTGQSVGLLATGQVDGASNTVTLDNVNLTSEAATGVVAQATSLDLILKNGTVLSGGDGVALSAISTVNTDGSTTYSDMDVTADGDVTLLGNVVTDTYENTLNLSLANNSVLTGTTQNVSQLVLDSTSRWLVTGDSNVKDLQQYGLVSFSSSNGEFSTLTVDGDLTGSGTFIMNTQLGDDTSPTDKILVTGNAEGNFSLTINNKDGLGDETDVGILLVEVTGDAQSATFTQNNSVVAGNYEYFLNQVNDNAWYLQSSYTTVTPDLVENTDDTDVDDSVIVAVIESTEENTTSGNKTWRPEVAGYLIAPYLNATYGFTSAGTYHERLGAMQGNRVAWGRVYGRHDSYSAGRFAFDVNTAFIQLGGDLLQRDLADNWHVKAGPTMTFGRQHSRNKDNGRSERQGLSVNVGKTDTTAYGVGGYVTIWNDDGSYLDSVGQLTRYSNCFTSLTNAKMDSYATLLSVEAGKLFTLSAKLRLEPQVQLMGQYMNISQTYASGVKLKDQNVFIGQARSGFRLSYGDPTVQPYVKADVIQQLGGTPGVDMNSETLRPEVRKGVWRAGAGINGKITRQLSLYADVAYSHSFGQGYEGYNGNLGVKYQF